MLSVNLDKGKVILESRAPPQLNDSPGVKALCCQRSARMTDSVARRRSRNYEKPQKGEAALRRSHSLCFFLFACYTRTRARMHVAHYPFGMGSVRQAYIARVRRNGGFAHVGGGVASSWSPQNLQRGAFSLLLTAFYVTDG